MNSARFDIKNKNLIKGIENKIIGEQISSLFEYYENRYCSSNYMVNNVNIKYLY